MCKKMYIYIYSASSFSDLALDARGGGVLWFQLKYPLVGAYGVRSVCILPCVCLLVSKMGICVL
jgi:hypothetical protein